MNNSNLLRIARKDWLEVKSNKELLMPLLLVPAILSIFLPLILSLAIPLDPGAPEEIAPLRAMLGLSSSGISDGGVMLIYMTNSMLKPYTLLIPTMVAMIIASDSIAGEKERKTIESFLVLPLSDREILVGKVLGALIPSLGSAWVSFLIMGFTMNIAGAQHLSGYIIVLGEPTWWLMEGLLVPLLSYLSTLFMVLISSIVKNVKAAQQYSALGVIPIIGLLLTSLSNIFTLNFTGILIVSAIMAGIALILTLLTTRNLNREKLVLALD